MNFNIKKNCGNVVLEGHEIIAIIKGYTVPNLG